MSTVVVQFPEGPREVPTHALARNKIGQLPATLRVPHAVPGFRLTRTATGWSAERATASA